MARAVRLDSLGIADVAKSAEMQRLIADVAEEVAANVRDQFIEVEGVPGDVPLPVEVTPGVSDRARASVTIAHPSGLAVQAKHGSLTRAAASAGLEVRSSG